MSKIFFKSLIKKPLAVKIISCLISGYMRFVFKTTRWQLINQDMISPYWDAGAPLVGCFWHNRLALMIFSWRKSQPFYMMISDHFDGRIISSTIGRYGVKTITVSSKGSTEGIRNAVKLIKQGISIGITPDGPRGPRFQADQGALRIARIAGVDIIPGSYSTTHRWVAQSWDRLIIPLPFGRGVFIWGKPIRSADIKTNASLKVAQKALDVSLIDLSNRADALCGHAPIPLRQAHERPIKKKT